MSQMHMSRIVAELPDGWGALDAAEFVGPGGVRVRVTGEPIGEEFDTDGLAERHGRLLADQVDGYREVDLRPTIAFAGQAATRRDLEFCAGDASFRGIVLYLVHGGRAYVASATGPAASFDDAEGDVMAVTDRLILLGTPLLTSGAANGDVTGTTPARSSKARPGLPADEWAVVRSDWLTGSPVVLDLADGPDFSEEELLVISGVLGAGAFPTVGPLQLAASPAETRTAVGRAITRSLLARGTLEIDGDELVIAEPLKSLLETAVYPDLLVEVSVAGGGVSHRSALCVRPAAMTIVAGDGISRRVADAPPGELVERVVGFAGLVSARPGEGSTRRVDLDDVERSAWLRCTWRDGSALVGAELRWAVVDGALYAAQIDSGTNVSTIEIRPVGLDDARGELLDSLPGA